MLALSTSWNYDEETDAYAYLAEAQAIGFSAIELGYRHDARQLADILEALKTRPLRVSSIHNYCPAPESGMPGRHISNRFRLSALNDQERYKAVEHTRRTINTAVLTGAQVVVIHAGTVEFDVDPSEALLKMYTEGLGGTMAFQQARKRLIESRQEKSGGHLKALEKSLSDIVPYARKNGIQIGLETRYYPTEMPNFLEIEHLLRCFGSEGLGYWHDTGHAEINDRLGITPHLDFLNAYSDKMIGIHLHGMEGARDHLAPFEGDMNLEKVFPYIGRGVIKVIESRRADREDLALAFKRLSKL